MLKNLKNLTLPEMEEKILEFWQKNKIFEKSLTKNLTKLKASAEGGSASGGKAFVFYDGPPFATGLPHYGHILTGIIKDAVPRYKTMRGFRVPRRWGWDCHGLPVENEIEKDLGFKTKKDIEKFGIWKFNETARRTVLRYADEWKEIIPRVGRWVDMENDYKTMDANYTESVWWVFKKFYDAGLVYEDYRVAPYCPRCGTPLSNFELNQPDAYRDIEDQSVYVKFEILNPKSETKLKTFLLAWTTTPWTLPGNVALAVNKNFDYVKIGIKNQESGIRENLILAKERLSVISDEYKIINEFKGKDLIGLKYNPLYKVNGQWSMVNGRRVVAADFVSVEDGTGIVHIAPAFGEDDMEVGKKEKLTALITVDSEGKIKKGLKIPGEGLFVKIADKEIKKDLSKRGLLFKEEKIVHSYPHCWRCETPLIYFPVSSWYIAVKKIKKQLIENNKKTHWIPAHIKTGRFGKWLEEVRDWDVARSRFWGAPIPVWRCQTGADKRGLNADRRGNSCGKHIVIGSLEELKKYIKKSGNNYFVMRHGQAESNAMDIINSDIKKNHFHLTKKGGKEAEAAAKKLSKEKINLIFSSDFLRAKQTAEMIAEHLGLDKKKIIFDKRLREVNTGVFEGKKPDDYRRFFSSYEEKFYKIPPKGENLTELKNRITEFLYEINEKYKDKNILIVSHEHPIWLLFSGAVGADAGKSVELKEKKTDFIKTGEVRSLNFTPLPHNQNFEIDFHRPYIDGIEFPCVCGGKMKRIPDVFDCWFESGAMPYAQAHYPFAAHFPFPAEFIAEGIDQTRGWFYTLLVLSTALFNKPAFKNVIVSGTILAENGQKMSKRLKNYPDPMEIINKYGADALRLYLLSSPAVKGENLNFSEKGVDEVYKKAILRLWNVYQFYDLYANKNLKFKIKNLKLNNILDKWILAMFSQLNNEVSKAMDSYELDKAVRPIMNFVDDFSTWYLRRSRRRFQKPENKKEFENASAVFASVLAEFSKVAAPFLPFIAEAIYRNLNHESRIKNYESVHLTDWPKSNSKLKTQNSKLIKNMAEIRRLASLALAKRAEAQIKVRQPLQRLKIKDLRFKIDRKLLEILADEINVKKIIFDGKIKNEIELDTKITPELHEEGIIRDFVRMVQGLRQEADYMPKDIIYLFVSAGNLDAVLNKNLDSLKKEVGAKMIEFRRVEKFDAEEETKIDNQKIWIGIKKI